jgi:glucans biosynthesis protein
MLRRHLSLVCWFAVGTAAIAQPPEPDRLTEPFDRGLLEARAAEMAKRPHSLPPRPEGADQERLSLDQYRSIQFDPAAAIWAREDRSFAVDLLYPGFIFDVPVNINLVVGRTARRVLFANERFSYGADVSPLAPPEGYTGYSGFRVRAELDTPEQLDEFLVFQGASYFRAVAKGQTYGTSARGLAVRTARPEGEEFPVFTDFWIERPAEHAEQIVIHALLQSASVVGVYTFNVLRPGDETVIDVDVVLFPRVELTAFGIAPLTSMFLFDASNRTRFDDYREAVHHADGLQIVNGRGERLWRPLANPRALQVSAFVDDSPKGFGLVQRKREFADYQDADARFDRRPSLWIEPGADWGPGHVELVEIPSPREVNDNIVAYWQPRTPIPAGERRQFSYRVRFTTEPLDESLARVMSTRVGQSQRTEGRRAFVIDFKGAGEIPGNLVPEVWSSAGEVFAPRGEAIPQTGVYRVAFELDPKREDLVELRTVLYSDGKPWAETWLYRWSR